MSIASWMAEFYPVGASETSTEEASTHSLRKWIGLRKENLERHGLRADDSGDLQEIDAGSYALLFRIDADTCALCFHFEQFPLDEETCPQCPITKATGSSCIRPRVNSPWSAWMRSHDAEPMIGVLELAKQWQEKQVAEGQHPSQKEGRL